MSCAKTMLATVLLPTLVACAESVESTDVRTTGIYPEISVTADGGGSAEVTVTLKVGGAKSNTYLDLKYPDRLLVSAGDLSLEMDQGGNKYRAELPIDEGSTEFTVAFLRDGEGDAPSSTVMLPPGFELTIEDDSAVRPNGDVSYTWEPKGNGDANWQVEGTCIYDNSGTTPDDGSGVLPSDAIDDISSYADEDCSVTLSLARGQNGKIDKAFTQGGKIVATQTRTGVFVSRAPKAAGQN